MSEHKQYWSENPTGDDQSRTIAVRLANRDLQVRTSAGIFSPSRVDPGTAILLPRIQPSDSTGNILDLGCGWGPITLTAAYQYRQATIWGVDVNERALNALRHTASTLGLSHVRTVRPEEVPESIQFAAIWSNPPIRIGKHALRDLLMHWLPTLQAGADAHLVVQRHLGSDSLHAWLASNPNLAGWAITRTASAKGYRILRVTRPK
ncbi:MAG: class I SAM-dependent methyltransferase [Actinomycetota bacterium]